MRRLLSVLLCLMLALMMLPLTAAAESTRVITVSLSEDYDDSYANMAVLSNALAQSQEGVALTVKIAQPGRYYLGSVRTALKLRSNTTLDLNDATLVRSEEMGNLIQNCDWNGDTGSGTGYTQTENIAVINGTLDGSGGADDEINLVNLGHASGIRLSNLTLKNCTGGHLIELTGCADAVVSGCTFTGYTASKPDNSIEAIQLDICDNTVAGSWNGVYNSDSTPCRNITVDNCTFIDYPSGVGNHKGIAGAHNTAIRITNNLFRNSLDTVQPAIWAYDFDNSTIAGNVIIGNYGTGIKLSAGENNTVQGNEIHLDGIGIHTTLANSYTLHQSYVVTKEHVLGCTIKDNLIYTTGNNIGVCIYNSSTVTSFSGNTVSAANATAFTASGKSRVLSITGNTVTSSSAYGMLLATNAVIGTVSVNNVSAKNHGIQTSSSAAVTTLSDNTVTSSAGSGIYVTAATATTITGNTVKNCGANGILVSSSGVVTTVSKNTVTGCVGYGIRINNPSISVQFGGNALSGNTAGESKISATIKPLYIAVDTPVITALSNTYGGVKISWGSIAYAEKYRVFVKTSSGWKTLGNTSSTAYTHTAAVSGTKYTYTVRCISTDLKKYTSSYNSTGKSITYVAAPSVTALSNTLTGVKLTWGAVAGAATYRVFVKTSSGWKTLGNTSSTAYTHTAAVSGTKYTYTVRALNSKGAYVSGYNATGWKKTFIAAPQNPTLTNTSGGVRVSFEKPVGAVKFRVFRKTGSSSWSNLTDTTASAYTDTAAKSGVTYTYTVRCISADASAYTSAYRGGSTITCRR